MLLAGPDDRHRRRRHQPATTGRPTGSRWRRSQLSLAELLSRRGLVLRSDLLGAWAHWITPAFEPRRYDTRFFVAVLPEGQQTRDVSGESDAVAWMRPRDALAAVRDGRLGMMPPTVRTCTDVADLARRRRRAARGGRRRVATVEPRAVVVDGDELWLETDEEDRRDRRPISVLAPNPGPMTLDGTNTWVLRGSDRRRGGRSVVVDPGPLDEGHLDAVRAEAGDVAVVLLTHRHADHSEGAAAFAASVGCGVRAADPAFRVGDDGLDDGDVIEVDGLELRSGHPGAHLRLGVVPAAARRRLAAHRRHRARPRHLGGRPPGRAARARTSTRCGGCATWPARRRDRGCCPATARCSTTRSRCWTAT